MQKRILADHSVVSDIVSERLRREGYLIEEAKKDQKALTVTRPENYAAIISDVFRDGLRVLEKAKVIPFPVACYLNIRRTRTDQRRSHPTWRRRTYRTV
jgi:CheY-like chemotaxis protein